MFLNNFEIFITKAIDTNYICKTIESLYETVPESFHDQISFQIISEKLCHEDTLNEVLKRSSKDVLIVADDIIFKSGWLQALEKNLGNGDIIGFSMLKPNTETLLDFGYDFVSIDGELSYQSEYKGMDVTNVKLATFRECDSVCGCCMYIKKEVIQSRVKFQRNGHQRWGEMIFSQQAREIGFKTIVLSQHIYHYGFSTKKSKDVSKSSISWQVEKGLWDKVKQEFFTNVSPIKNIIREMGANLKKKLDTLDAISLYGSGTVAEFIVKNNPNKKFLVYSGLTEEIGKDFLGAKIQDIKFKEKTELFLITAIGYEKEIFDTYFIGHDENKVVKLFKKIIGDKIIFEINE